MCGLVDSLVALLVGGDDFVVFSALSGLGARTVELVLLLTNGGDTPRLSCALSGLGVSFVELVFLLTGVVEGSWVYSALCGGSAVFLLDTDVGTFCVLSMLFEAGSCAAELVVLLSSADVDTLCVMSCVVEFMFLLLTDCASPITTVVTSTFLEPVVFLAG